jgi:hypothetical protein
VADGVVAATSAPAASPAAAAVAMSLRNVCAPLPCSV